MELPKGEIYIDANDKYVPGQSVADSASTNVKA